MSAVGLSRRARRFVRRLRSAPGPWFVQYGSRDRFSLISAGRRVGTFPGQMVRDLKVDAVITLGEYMPALARPGRGGYRVELVGGAS